MKKVTFINYGEPTVAYHSSNKSDEKIKEQYKLENLEVISIEEVKEKE